MQLPSRGKSCLVQPPLRKTLGQALRSMRPRESHLPASLQACGTEPSEVTALRGHSSGDTDFLTGTISRAEFHLPPCSPSMNEPTLAQRAEMEIKGQLSH